MPLARYSRLGVAAMPQHFRDLRFHSLIARHKRAASGRVPVGSEGECHAAIPNVAILIVATDGFEEWELFGPRQILQERGAEVVLASLTAIRFRRRSMTIRARRSGPTSPFDEADADDFDALILPGGVRNPDQLRMHGNVIGLIRDFAEQGKPIGAICHGPWLLIEADLLRGRTRDQLALDPHRPPQRRRPGRRPAGGHRRQSSSPAAIPMTSRRSPTR